MSDPTTQYPLDGPSWTPKGVDELVDGDIIRIDDSPTIKDPSKRCPRGSYKPVLGKDGRPIYGKRRTIGRVVGLSPTLGHPNARFVASMSWGFYRSVYAEVLYSEGYEAHSVGQTTSFLQHNANVVTRKTVRWPLTGPNWPAPSKLRERVDIVRQFMATACAQRDAIRAWEGLRDALDVAAGALRQRPKEVLEELAPPEIMADVDATRLWVAKLWNGQSEMTPELRTSLARLVHRLANQIDETKAVPAA